MRLNFRLLLRLFFPLLLLAFLAAGCSDEPEVVEDSAMTQEPTGVPGMPDNLNLICGDLRVALDPTMVPLELHVDDASHSVRAEHTPTGVKFVGTGIVLTMQGEEVSLMLDGEQYDCSPAEDAP